SGSSGCSRRARCAPTIASCSGSSSIRPSSTEPDGTTVTGASSRPPRRLSLAHLTVLDTTPPELVTVAAAAGFRTIGIRLTATPSVGVPPYDCLHDGPLLRETLAR